MCVDLDKLDANIAKMQAALRRNKLDSRPHAKTHKCAAIAKLQMAAGAIGICTAKLSEAEAMVAQGVDKVCMTTGNLSPNKIRRAMQLRKRGERLHPGGGLRAERARPVGRGESKRAWSPTS